MKQNLLKTKLILILLFLSACKNHKSTISLPKESVESHIQLKVNDNKDIILESPTSATNDIQNSVSPMIIGNVITENQSSLAFLNSGTIEKMYVKAGDHVKKDQILASLINTHEQINLQATEIKLKQKKLAVELENKKLDRMNEQFEAGIINKASLEAEKSLYESTVLDFEETQNDLKGKKYNIKMSKIYAPYEGIISQKNKSVGDFVSAGTTVFEITQNTNLEIFAQVPSIYFDKLKSGMKLKN